ncbi:DNRLRE domain-containing protein [Nonomuraea fuscirosea]|uniref:DNRLRE domain-containing protein n=1 Tax=Nonomuraea fuscirosea TaxID=1291556 RepID=UPI002DDA1EB4|nr:DNRLRE domain-containing protein [Nonomuraea fuscirosea]WSA52690.1 DNRLRE domain-containing protein [Nonomuraea fuscirosea]
MSSPTPTPAPQQAAANTPTSAKLAQAKKDNKRVEIEALRSETGTYYANPDGKTLTAEVSSAPVRVKKNGDWQPLDPTLIEENGVLRPKVAKGDITLSLGGDKTAVAYKGDKGEGSVSVPAMLPKPVVKGNTATYPDAYGAGADLVIRTHSTGFRHEIVLRQRPAKELNLRVPLTLPKGLKLGKGSDKTPGVLDSKGKEIADLASALVLDATEMREPATGHMSQAETSLEGDSTLVLKPDAEFLADPAVTYPVTLAAPLEDWVGTGIAGDTFVSHSYPSSASNKGLNRIIVGRSNSGTVTWRGYIRFNIKGTPLEGGTVDNADLRLWNYDTNDCSDTATAGIVARRITSDWDINTMTWGSGQPNVTPNGQSGEKGAYGVDCPEGEGEIWHTLEDITQEWMDGADDYGVQLSSASESVPTNWRWYRSDEYGGYDTYPFTPRGPVLIIKYEPAVVKSRGYVLPYYDNPTLSEIKAETYYTDTVPAFPEVTEEDARAVRENSVEYALEDSSVGFNVPTDMTREEWLESLDVEPVTPNPSPSPVPTPTPLPTPAGRWSFEEGTGQTAADSAGSGHDATLGATTRWVPGKTGTALSNSTAEQGVAALHQPAPLDGRAAAAREAASSGQRVTVLEETTDSSITYAAPDGKTFTTEYATGPVRTKKKGSWVPIDTTLVDDGGTWRPRAIAQGVEVKISAGGDAPFARMSAGGHSYALRWPTPLPKPRIHRNTATYADAGGTGADLVVTALSTGFRHEVVLRQRPAKPVELRIEVEDEGLALSEGKDGRLLLKGKDDKLIATGTRPVVSDGSGEGRLPLPKLGKVGTEVFSEDGRTELVVKPDQAFLADASTTYPVRVAAAVTLPVSADMEVTTHDTVDSPALPDTSIIMAGTMVGWIKSRTHLKFDTPSLQGSTVTNATLSMNTVDSHNCGTALARGIQVARLTGGWDPENLYWDGMPAFTAEDASTNFKGVNSDCAVYPDRMDWDVTGIAQDWAAGAANHGLVLKSPGEADVNNYRAFTSSEDTDFNAPPTLTIITSGSAQPPTATELAMSPAQNVNGAIVTSSVTPQLAATVSDIGEASLTAEFEVEHDPSATSQGTGQIWAGTSVATASGGRATVVVPAGKLVDGWKARWRVRAVNGATSATSDWSEWQSFSIETESSDSGPMAMTSGPVLRTNDSFTIAAWLRWSDKDGDFTVLEQKGDNVAPFRFGNDPEHGLVFTLRGADSTDAASEGVVSGTEPPVNEWFHLAGVYDATAGLATLYLNGAPLLSEPVTQAAWNAATALSLGTRMDGNLDEVVVFQQALTAAEVSTLPTLAAPAEETATAAPRAGESATAAPRTAAAASSAFPYQRLSHKECQDEIAKRPNRPAAIYKNAFNMCWVMRIGEVKDNSDDNELGDVFMYTAKLTVVMHSYVGIGWKAAGSGMPARDAAAGVNSRQIKAWVRIDNWDALDDDYLERSVAVGLGVGGSGCTTNFPNGRTATLEQWINESKSSPENGFEMTIDAPGSGTGDQIRYCKISPWVNYQQADLESRHYHLHPTKNPALFRCDTSRVIKSYKGGCIVWHIRPIFMLDENDDLVTKSASHIAAALYNPQTTIPKAGNGVPKKIPGAFQWWAPGCTYGGCLKVTRASAKVKGTIPYNNRKKAISTCKLFIRQYWDPDSCDEYPFASTLQGASQTDYHFSVAVIEGEDNCLAGSRLGHWYNRVRLLETDEFWVDTIARNTSSPRSGAPGYVATNPTPEELFHLDGCTVDG